MRITNDDIRAFLTQTGKEPTSFSALAGFVNEKSGATGKDRATVRDAQKALARFLSATTEDQQTRGLASLMFSGRLSGTIDEAQVSKEVGRLFHQTDPLLQTTMQRWKKAGASFTSQIMDARKQKFQIGGCAYFFKEDGLITLKQATGDLKALMPPWPSPLALDADPAQYASRISDQLAVDLAAAVIARRKLTGTSTKKIDAEGTGFIVGFWPAAGSKSGETPRPLKISIMPDRTIQVGIEQYDGGTRATYQPNDPVPRGREASTKWVTIKTVSELPQQPQRPERARASGAVIEKLEEKMPDIRREIIVGLGQVARDDGTSVHQAYEKIKELMPDYRYQVHLALAQAATAKQIPMEAAAAMYKEISAAYPNWHYMVPTRLAHAAILSGKSAQEAIDTHQALDKRYDNWHRHLDAVELVLLTGAGEKNAAGVLDKMDETSKLFDKDWRWYIGVGFGEAVVFANGAVTGEQAHAAMKRATKALSKFNTTIPLTLARIAVANMRGVDPAKVEERLPAEVDRLIASWKNHSAALNRDSMAEALHLTASRGAKNEGAAFLALMRPWTDD